MPAAREVSREWDDLAELEDVSFEDGDKNIKPVQATNNDTREHITINENVASDNNGAPTRDQMYTMFTHAGMSIPNAEVAVERLFTFDEREWTREDLIACMSRDTGDLLVRVLQELRVTGIESQEVQHGIINARYWVEGFHDSLPPGQTNTNSHRGKYNCFDPVK